MTARDRVVLAFDFGLRRLGVATGNLLTRTATPLTTLDAGAGPPWSEIDMLVRDWAPDTIVVGVPVAERGSATEERIREFVAALEQRYSRPVDTVDEALSSRAAASDLREHRRERRLRRRVQKSDVDRHAARLIAEQWMSAN